MRFLLALLVGIGAFAFHGVAQATPSRAKHENRYYTAPQAYQTMYGAKHHMHRHYTHHHRRHHVRHYYGRRHYSHYRRHYRHYAHYQHYRHYHRGHHVVYGHARYIASSVASRFGDRRPSRWCGFAVRQWKGVRNTAYNLARNWAHWGRRTTAHIGAVVVWVHHVGIIVGPCGGGRCVVKSGNYNNRVAVASMNVRNAIAFREE